MDSRFLVSNALAVNAEFFYELRISWDHVADTRVPMPQGGRMSIEKMVKTDAEWKQILTPEQYQVTRHGGTECAFTGQFWDFHEERSIPLRLLRRRAFSFAKEVRVRHGLAELLGSGEE